MTEISIAEQAKRDVLKASKPLVWEKIQEYPQKVMRGESIAIIQYQHSYVCNMACRHCCITPLRRPSSTRHFEISDTKELARQADAMGLAHWVITGGEPLMFKDFDQIVEAIDPSKFYITSDTNGLLLDSAKAKHLKEIGVDKIQLSLDSLSASEHDAFRRHTGSWAAAVRAIDACKEAGLNLILSTVVTKNRIRSFEFTEFLGWAGEIEVPVFVTYAKPVGAWRGRADLMIDKSDMEFMGQLEKQFNVFTHLTPSYGMDIGCIAVKRMISVTAYGDVMPCPYMHVSLGNVFKEPLKDIVDRTLGTTCFGRRIDTCLVAEDVDFVESLDIATLNRPLPIPYKEMFGEQA